jgi:selenoprotein W-related protein
MSRIRIHYCAQCQWLLRSAWLAQELLSTLGEDLDGVELVHAHGGHLDPKCDLGHVDR